MKEDIYFLFEDRKSGKEFWEIKGNLWDKAKYTERKANDLSFTMEDCKGCIDCRNCKRSTGLINCRFMSDCKDCVDCGGCEDCFCCKDCSACIKCVNCEDCVHCFNSLNLSKMSWKRDLARETNLCI